MLLAIISSSCVREAAAEGPASLCHSWVRLATARGAHAVATAKSAAKDLVEFRKEQMASRHLAASNTSGENTLFRRPCR